MLLKKVEIYKYKSIEEKQEFFVDEKTTVLVGMNESGKTSVLEAIAKANYFMDDENFRYKDSRDYPRKELIDVRRKGIAPLAIKCTYYIDDELLSIIEEDIGKNVLLGREFQISYYYDNDSKWVPLNIDRENFIKGKTEEYGISSDALNRKLLSLFEEAKLNEIIEVYTEESKRIGIKNFEKYFENQWDWEKSNILASYISKEYLNPNLPKFLYYDEYYALPSRISLNDIHNGVVKEESAEKTAKALIELAQINVSELIKAEDFEEYVAQLEATESSITDELFKYWSTNCNLDIKFEVDKKEGTDTRGTRIVDHILDIRVHNSRARVTLPLANRSRGFNWFFSFLVWFKKIQEDQDSQYILLLDEPGLNLHAKAQADLLKFIEDLSDRYQIIFTTHSPFMIDSNQLNKVRTVVEKENGTIISNSIQEKDPNTLFPLQAALGYDIAQNLYISEKNLLVEGVSDLIFLKYFSCLVEESGSEGLRQDITIVPVGGTEKIATFVSILRGNELPIVCLLDSNVDGGTKQRLDNIVKEKLIKDNKIRFYDEFIDNLNKADIEDMLDKKEYLDLFNYAFKEHDNILISSLNSNINNIVIQINNQLSIDRYNHYRPAKAILSKEFADYSFSAETLDRFGRLFSTVNRLFD